MTQTARLRDPDPKTQNGRVLRFLREHPGSTVMECSFAADLGHTVVRDPIVERSGSVLLTKEEN